MERKELKTSYYSRNKDAVKARAKAYYEANKQAILERNRERGLKTYTCEACNREILISNKSNHVRTFKHQDNVALLKQNEDKKS